MDKPILIVVSGLSGAGKGTMCKHLCRMQKDIKLSVSATTRKPRPREAEGVNYFYKSEEEFETMIQNKQFLEYAKVYDNYYGTPKKYVDNCLKEHDVILEIDPQGAMQIKKTAPDALYIFIVPPTIQAQYDRLKGRGSETDAQLRKRLNSARSELDMAEEYDYIIVNDNLEKAVLRMKHAIEAERSRSWRKREFIKELKESKFYD
ncbi:MAG: guanylate kinase [Clostridiales bacterium]|nr:guanylate kinase [Clostridiales bacterium]